LANAAFPALPSHDEGVPLALLEAMVAGVTVVATSVGGAPEIVEDGRHALLMTPHDPDTFVDQVGAPYRELLANP
jgi:glycosyltransferase involved in cell wall biosynthesis